MASFHRDGCVVTFSDDFRVLKTISRGTHAQDPLPFGTTDERSDPQPISAIDHFFHRYTNRRSK